MQNMRSDIQQQTGIKKQYLNKTCAKNVELNMPKYRLLIKWGNTKESLIYERKKPITFSVIDIERGSYPFNWICNLPKDTTSLCKNSSFSRLFREKDSITFAIELLKKARKEYDDQTVRKEIEIRLDKIQKYLMQTQPSTQVIS